MRERLLQELNDFSLRITRAIELNDWEQLSSILRQRQEYLEILLSSPLSVEDQQTVQGILESIKAMDELFIDAVQLKKTELLKQFKSITHGKKSIRAYYTT